MNSQIIKKIHRFVQKHAWDQLDLVMDLCHQNSYTAHKAGSDSVAARLLESLEGIFTIHNIIEQTNVGNHHVLRNRKRGPYIMLVGHLDTVFPPNHPFKGCQMKGDHLTGPGTADMKGGLAVFVYALLALQETGLLEDIPITLLLNSDEEIGSETSISLFHREKRKAKVCLVGECGGPGGSVVVSRNGKAGGRVSCRGQERHVGSGTHKKASAILEAAHKVIALESLNECLPAVSINVGQIQGGLGPSTIPGEASFLMDARWKEEDHYPVLMKKIQDCVTQPVQSFCTCDFKEFNRRPAMPLTDSTRQVFSLLHGIGESMDMKIEPEHRRGTSDANFFGAAGVPTLDGLGPVGDRDHTPDEYILWPTLASRTVLLTSFIIALTEDEDILKI